MNISVNSDSFFESNLELELSQVIKSKEPAWQERAVKILKRSWAVDPQVDWQRIRRFALLSDSCHEKIEQLSRKSLKSSLHEAFRRIVPENVRTIAEIREFLLEWILEWAKQTRYVLSSREWTAIQNHVDFMAKAILDTFKMVHSSQNENTNIQTRVMLGRSLEIKEIYKETHHVFLHAQNSGLLILPHLIKEFVRALTPEKCAHQFKYLRLPDFSRDWTITKYSKTEEYINDGYGDAQDDLLSCDAHFFHKEAWESSLFFLEKNTNMLHSSLLLIENILSHFCPNLSNAEIANYAGRISDITTSDTSEIGNLFVLCVPKERSFEIQYCAHAFGNPCNCHDETAHEKILEKIQNDEMDQQTLCNNGFEPQYRLFTPAIKPENDVKIYFIPSCKAYADHVKASIRQIVSEIIQNSHIVSDS